MDGRNERRQRGSGPAQQRYERPGEPPPDPTDVPANVDTESHLCKRQDTECRGEKEPEEKERNPAELPLE
jgi:hypothetical protein